MHVFLNHVFINIFLYNNFHYYFPSVNKTNQAWIWTDPWNSPIKNLENKQTANEGGVQTGRITKKKLRKRGRDIIWLWICNRTLCLTLTILISTSSLSVTRFMQFNFSSSCYLFAFMILCFPFSWTPVTGNFNFHWFCQIDFPKVTRQFFLFFIYYFFFLCFRQFLLVSC